MKTVPIHGLAPVDSFKRRRDKIHVHKFGGDQSTALPLTLSRSWLPREDQKDTEFCTAYQTSKARAYATGIDMLPEFQVAVEGEYAGNPILDGTDPHTAMNAARLNGSLPKQFAPAGFTLTEKGADFISDWMNWPKNVFPIAQPYAPHSPYGVGYGTGDVFDNIRGALYSAFQAGENEPVMADGNWYMEWNMAANDPSKKGRLPVPTQSRISLHAYLFIDWITDPDGTPWLVGHLSQGELNFGDQGMLYFNRETVNKAFGSLAQQQIDGTGLYIWRKNAPINWGDIRSDLLARLRAIAAQALGRL